METIAGPSALGAGTDSKYFVTKAHTGHVVIDLVGVPRVTGPTGQDLTPRGMRKRAIIGLVALSPNQTVSRRWLEAMLWPESDAARASASLRQAIAGIRRVFSDSCDVLNSDRFDIGLDRACVQVDVLDAPAAALQKMRSGRDLLEGIDVSSEEFEEWLRQERATLSAQADNAGGPKNKDASDLASIAVRRHEKPLLMAETSAGQNDIEFFVAECILGQVGQTVTELIRTDFRVQVNRSEPVVHSPSSMCSIRVQEMVGQTYILVRLTDRITGRLFWHRRAEVDTKERESIFDVAASLATEAAQAFAVRDANASEAQVANALAVSAIEDIFSFDPKRLTSAQSKLSRSNEIDPHAPRPALRALAKAFAALEDPAYSRDDLQDMVRPLIEESRRLDRDNPIALAFLADVFDHVFDDPETAMGLAKCAIRANPGFGYAHAGLSAMELLQGNLQKALSSAQRAHRQLQNTSLEVLSLMRLCVASMNAGLESVALDAAQRAADLAPFSCPPLRHLYSLKLASGDNIGAGAVLKRLKTIEPEFSMRRLRDDPSYPGSSIRRMGYHKLPDVEQ